MNPETEFRTLPVSSPEPDNRATGGTVIGEGESFDLGTVDTTDEAQDIPVRVFWWRVKDMDGAAEITNIRVWISDTSGYVGTDDWYMDICNTWTQGKTPVQVKTGKPGAAPFDEPEANLMKHGGGTITGTTHAQTSQYIYLTGTIGVNESMGEKTGLKLTLKFDYH